MIKKFIMLLCLIISIIGLIGTGNTTLIGDNIVMTWYHPDLSTSIVGSSIVTVQAGLGDQWVSSMIGYDVEESSIHAHYDYHDIAVSTSWYSAPFNGLKVSDLDYSPETNLLGVTIDTNIEGWDSSRVQFGDDWVTFNWQGLTVYALQSSQPLSYFNADLNFGTSPIPEPATCLLLLCGLIGAVGIKKKVR